MTGTPQQSDSWSGMGVGWAVTSTLMAGMVTMGGIGYFVDLLVGTHRVFMATGMVLGTAIAIYSVYLRYGKGEDGQG